MRFKPFISIVLVIILSILVYGATYTIEVQQLTTTINVENSNDGGTAAYCQGFKVNNTRDYYVNVSVYLGKGSGTVTLPFFMITKANNASSCRYDTIAYSNSITYVNDSWNSYLMTSYASLTAGTQYCLCLYNNGQSASQYIAFNGSSGSSYSNGSVAYTTIFNNASTWVGGTNDLAFKIAYTNVSTCIWDGSANWRINLANHCNITTNVDLKSTGYNVSFENGTSGDYVNITAVINVSGFPNTTFGLAGALTKIYFWNSSAKLKSG